MAKKPTYEELEQRIKELEREVSQCSRAAEELSREQSLFIGGPVVVFTWLATENWPAAYVSPNVTQFGYQANDFVSGTILYMDIIHRKDLDRVLSEVGEYTESGVPFYEQEYRIIQADGETKWVHDFTIVRRNDQREVTHYDGYILEITERKQAQEDKEKLQAQLLQSEKMASVGQLAAGIAHEINNPTGFISSNLNTLKDYQNDITRLSRLYRKLIADLRDTIAKENLPSSIAKQVEEIVDLETEADIDYVLNDLPALIEDSQEGTERIKKIVVDLKDFAHPGEDKLSSADINKGLDSTLNVVWNELKYKATVTKDYGDLPLISCYPQQLNQVFMNILVNAAQAIEKQGEIKIVTRALDEYAEIKISDTGAGIPEENLSKIFDPFFTSKEVGKGTGLGLNVAYNIIKKHEGTIDVESTVGEGTTFTIRIPVVQGEED